MHQQYLTSLYVLIFVAFVPNVVAQASSTVSISDAPDMAELRNCAKCVLSGCDNDINGYLGCNWNNGCFCRTDLFSQVTSYVSSVINSDCTPGPASDDIASANSIYSQYCATVNGLATTATTGPNPDPSSTAAPGATESPPTSTTIEVATATISPLSGSSGSSVTTTLVTSTAPPSQVIQTQYSTTTVGAGQTPSTGSNSPSSLSGGEIAGIVIGVVSAIGTIAGAYLAWKLLKHDPNTRDLRGRRYNTPGGSSIGL